MQLFRKASLLHVTDSISPPNNTYLAEVSRGQLKFKWFTNDGMCPTNYTYAILSSNCGACPNITVNTTATCHVLNNRVCTFAVQIMVCGHVFGNTSVQSITVMVKGTQMNKGCIILQ